MRIVPRDYQLKAESALDAAYSSGLHRPGIQMPTGTGKTVVIARCAKKVLQGSHTSRNNIILHRDTLVDQTIRKLLAVGVDPDDIGVVKANRNEIHKRCLIVSIHSLRDPERLKQLPKPQLTTVDEAHVSVSQTYKRLYEHLGNDAYLAGFTATWMRSDRLGLGDVWEEVVFKRTIGWAVARGYLVPPHAIQLGGDLDLSNVRTTAEGDYNERDLEQTVMIDDLQETVVEAYHTITPGKSMALFAPTQASARFFAEALRASGVPTAEIFAGTKPKDRKWAFHGFETGAVKVLASCSALAEGWDSPRCDGVMMLRRTKFPGRFIQEAGRALRPWPGKEKAWLLDFVGTLDEKDMRCAVDLSVTPEKDEDNSDQSIEPCDICGSPRILKYIKQTGENLCTECVNKLDIEPEEREHLAKKINGVVEVDLFAGTTARWLKTDFGMPFISTSEKSKSGTARTFFIAPINGAWNVGVTGSVKSFSGGRWLAEGVTAPEAMEIGSEAALDDDPTIVHKKAAWRRGDASEKQLAYARSIGINPEGMNKAQVADAITIRLANRTLGAVYRPVYANLEGPG
jgi:superfamily II DNA or RNA helicase